MGRHVMLPALSPVPVPRVLDAAQCAPLPVEPALRFEAGVGDWQGVTLGQKLLEWECGNAWAYAAVGYETGAVKHELAAVHLSAELVEKLTALGVAEDSACAWVTALRRVVDGHYRQNPPELDAED